MRHNIDVGKIEFEMWPKDMITPQWLMQQHHGLTMDEAQLLWLFCVIHTIRFKECYGEGQVMFPLWCNIMDNLNRQVCDALK